MDLHGGCACGRNVYVVEIPKNSGAESQIVLDNSASTRRHHASPFAIFLSVPVSYYHSSTLAFYPDETHRSIRRTFISPFDSALRRQFCGYCGTQLSQWREDANGSYIQVTLGSLFTEDLEVIEDMGLLAFAEDTGREEDTAQGGDRMDVVAESSFAPVLGPQHRGMPWYESLVEETTLGRIKRQRGGQASGDGTFEYEWEVTEWTESGDEDENSDITPGKRKIGEVEEVEHRETRM